MENQINSLRRFFKLIQAGKSLPWLLIVLFSLVQMLTVGAQSMFDKEIVFSDKEQTLGQLLHTIEEAADLHFTYSVQKIDLHQIVDLPQVATVNALLDRILNLLDIQHTIFNDNVVLSRKYQYESKTGTTLDGIIISQSGEPLFFANVVLSRLSGDSTLISGAVTDELGKFNFNDLSVSSYKVSISFIGYETVDTIVDLKESTSLGHLILKEKVDILAGVKVTSRRRLIQQKMDRLVVDVENSLLASKGNALDVLASTPGVSVQNDKVNMIGKSSVGFLVDDKLIKLPTEEIANFLRSISSEDIMNVEVISTPPAKYEAEGNSGLIHIILKDVIADSWNANIRGGYVKKSRSAGNIGGSYTYNKNKWSFAGSVFGMKGLYYQEQDDYAYFPDGLWYTLSPLLSDYERFNARADIDFQVTPSWSIGGQFMHSRTDYIITDNPYTAVYDDVTNEVQRHLLSTFSQMNWQPRFSSVNLNSSFDLDSLGKKVQVNLDYFNFQNSDVRRYEGESVIYNPRSIDYYQGINSNDQGIDNVSLGVDVDFPLHWAEIGFGTKVTQSISTNDIFLFNSGLTEELVTNHELDENDFSYEENIQAIYGTISRSLGEKFQAQLGTRLEFTQTRSSSLNLNLDQENKYVRLFPTFFLTYKVSDRSSYSLTYGRRIQRPTFGELNPNIFFINPFQTIIGNAFLQPSFSDNLEFSSLHGNLSGKLYYSREEDIFAQIPIPDPNTKLITFTNENYVNTSRYGLSMYYVFDELNWWTITSSANVNYSRSSFDLEVPHDDLTGFSSTFSTTNDFRIKAIDGLVVNIGFRYTLPGRNYIFNTGAASNLSASIQWQFFDKKLKVSLTGNDLLKDDAEILEATVNGVYQTARYYFDNRTVALSVAYNFGNRDISAKRHKTSNVEERRRAGN